MMHIIKNFFEKLTFKLFEGGRVPVWSAKKCPKPKKTNPEEPGYAAKVKHYNESRARWKRACDANKKCIFTKADQNIVDRRVKELVGAPNWIKSSMVQTQTNNTNTKNNL